MTDLPTLIGIAERAKVEAPAGFYEDIDGDIAMRHPDGRVLFLDGEYVEGCTISEFQVAFDPPTVHALLQRLHKAEFELERLKNPRTPFDKESP
jgi:hypothetical protein